MKPSTIAPQYHTSGSYHRRKKKSVIAISVLVVTILISAAQFAGSLTNVRNFGNLQQFAVADGMPPCIQKPAQQDMNATEQCGGDGVWNRRLKRCQPAMKDFVNCGNNRSTDSCNSCGTSGSTCGGQCKWAGDHCCSDNSVEIMFMTELQVTYLHELMWIVSRILNEKKVPYFLQGGTLLGSMRNRPAGLFRWDDDIDIGVKDEYYDDMHATIMADPRIGFMKKGWGGNAYGLKGAKIEHNTKRYSLDILRYGKFNHSQFGDHWYVIQKKTQKLKERVFFTDTFVEDWEIDALRPCSLWDMHDLKCLNESRTMMKRHYGDGAFTESVIFNHHTTTKVNFHPERININSHLFFLPALNKPLAKKLIPTVEFDSEDDFGWNETESKNEEGETTLQVSLVQHG